MMMESRNSPMIMQRIIDEIFSNMKEKNLLICLYNIIVYDRYEKTYLIIKKWYLKDSVKMVSESIKTSCNFVKVKWFC